MTRRTRPKTAATVRSARIARVVRIVTLLTALSLGGCVSLRPFEEILRERPAAEFVDVGGQAVHVLDRGAKDAPVLVLLHGFGASSASWRKLSPQLEPTLRTLAIDMNAFGYTERTLNPDSYTLDGQAALVIGVLDALGIERAHLAGHSYGGGVAQWIASHHPERVNKLILIDSTSPIYAGKRRSRGASLRPVAGLFLRIVALRPSFIRRGLEGTFFDKSLVTDEMVKLYLDPLKTEGSPFAYRAISKPNPNEPRTFDPSQLRQPTLAIWGANDTLISVEAAKEVAGTIPDLRFVVLPECGHNPHEEKPDETAREILDFLATAPNRP